MNKSVTTIKGINKKCKNVATVDIVKTLLKSKDFCTLSEPFSLEKVLQMSILSNIIE